MDILELLNKAKIDLKPLLSTLTVNKARLRESSGCTSLFVTLFDFCVCSDACGGPRKVFPDVFPSVPQLTLEWCCPWRRWRGA